MHNNLPLVSVVIFSYNQKSSLKRALESVFAQSYDNIQIVISDDFSTDGSREYLRAIEGKFGKIIKLVFQDRNVGIASNKTAGLKAADGDLITYLDGDDFYFPNKIELEVQQFLEDESLDVVYSNFAYTGKEGDINQVWADDDWSPIVGYILPEVYLRKFPKKSLYRCELVRNEIIERINFYDLKLKTFEDWDSRIRMTSFANVGYSNYIGSAYVNDSNGISKTSTAQSLLLDMIYVVQKNRGIILFNSTITKEVKKFEASLLYDIATHSTGVNRYIYFTKSILKNPLNLIKIFIKLIIASKKYIKNKIKIYIMN